MNNLGVSQLQLKDLLMILKKEWKLSDLLFEEDDDFIN